MSDSKFGLFELVLILKDLGQGLRLQKTGVTKDWGYTVISLKERPDICGTNICLYIDLI